jgi:hypothetical protein
MYTDLYTKIEQSKNRYAGFIGKKSFKTIR